MRFDDADRLVKKYSGVDGIELEVVEVHEYGVKVTGTPGFAILNRVDSAELVLGVFRGHGTTKPDGSG